MDNVAEGQAAGYDVDDGFVGIDEAARFLGVSQATIRRMTASSRLRCYRFSRMGHRRFRKSDLLRAFEIRQNLQKTA